jgi:hypothetical protein
MNMLLTVLGWLTALAAMIFSFRRVWKFLTYIRRVEIDSSIAGEDYEEGVFTEKLNG